MDQFFGERQTARRLYAKALNLVQTLGPTGTRITKSQVAFSRRRGFAWIWTPDRYLGTRATAPLVLSIALSRRDGSPRWKQVIEPSPGRFMHHLEVHSESDLDGEVVRWLAEAWSDAA